MPSHLPHHLLPPTLHVEQQLIDDVTADYRRFAETDPCEHLEEYLANRYHLEVSSEYAGYEIRNPWGKASGQLSMTARQVEEDVEAGLGFVVLKTVIAQNEQGDQSMQAWAVKESRMVAEPIVGAAGETGWTISWKGRGWWQSFDDYLQLIRDARRIANQSDTLIVPSCKYHLPTPDEHSWKTSEYEFTTRRLLETWREADGDTSTPMPLEKDFSPTLAGSDRASAQTKILEWLRTVPELIATSAKTDGATAAPQIRLGLKVFNALFDDDFQLEMLRTIHKSGPGRPDFFIYGNRLFDPQREFDGHPGIAYGGPDLSDRNLRVMNRFQHELSSDTNSLRALPWSATGNITTGKMALEYALRGASSFQLHTFFQLPADVYRMKSGSKIQKALHELYFHPQSGLIVWMHHLAATLDLPATPIRLSDIVGRGLDARR